jgi:hypothetical protein
MTVRLLHTNHDIISPAVGMLGFPDGEIDSFLLVMAMPDDRSVFVDHVPTV